jgi:hypothetical protein
MQLARASRERKRRRHISTLDSENPATVSVAAIYIDGTRTTFLRTLPHSELGSEFTYALVGRAISLRLLAKSASASNVPCLIRNFACTFDQNAALKEIGDMIAHVVNVMATKEDVADRKHELKRDIALLHAQVNSIEMQLSGMKHG